jgi:molybdate transport system ATP-binding protein
MIDLSIRKELGDSKKTIYLSLNIKVGEGEFIALYGPSGSGKTSILRMISGLMSPSDGVISLNNKIVFDSSRNINIKPQLRDVGFCFQDSALFPNMNVYQNIVYALKKSQSMLKINQLLDIMELRELENMMPKHLSGGQKQRVALARALVQEPRILLLDEPLSSIDDRMRHKLQEFISTVHNSYNLTTILVSHNITEVNQLSDTVYVIEDGKIVHEGAPSVLNIRTEDAKSIIVDAIINHIIHKGIEAQLDLSFKQHKFKVLVPKTLIETHKIGDIISLRISNSDIKLLPEQNDFSF